MTTTPDSDALAHPNASGLEPLYLDKAQPAIWKAFSDAAAEVRQGARDSGVPRDIMELINVRVSQINGCAFCLDLHGRLAVKAGVSAQKLNVLPAWREAGVFTRQEQSALAIAEAVATLPEGPQRDAALESARRDVGDDAYSVMAWAAITIDAFNRVSIVSKHPVRPKH